MGESLGQPGLCGVTEDEKKYLTRALRLFDLWTVFHGDFAPRPADTLDFICSHFEKLMQIKVFLHRTWLEAEISIYLMDI